MMNFSLKYIFLLIFIANECVSQSINQDHLQLKFVFILMRHTNRAPLNRYKNQTDQIPWPRGLGELTDQGVWNAYRAGQALRERYLGFLHPLQRYTPSEIDVSTTEVDRCYQSAGYLLAGMYPPNEEQTWNKDLKWQPIPIKTSLSKDHQQFTGDPRLCPKYAMELHEISENAIKTEKVKKLINYMKNYTSSPLIHFMMY
ncbi:uncharacterized protein LOC100164093 precursor [Acyrthosiphon pisum]|uniref:acid phosphatase n=1 Tax=Acyrthosiphon pisum TaxID=7029 RepID=C4WW99_ACYPI|nr:uncharacterized protein LOC100164093 precursor [Acyrthosiphon pisum]BAH72169.1 ACYPI005134 [Acyrthosiphon pisum]|eukprot:NP_001280481.1 uncharacterized protein LOC100164093 precursor [Acyrthosiphon pisum]